MKLATQLLMIAATAGLAVLAANTRKTGDDAKPGPAVQVETDAWFI